MSPSNSSGSNTKITLHTSHTIAFCHKMNLDNAILGFLMVKLLSTFVTINHSFFNFQQFITVTIIGNNKKMDATGRRDVKIVTKIGKLFTLSNVLYVLQLASNLLSVCFSLKNPKIRFNFVYNKCEIMFIDQEITTAKFQDSLLHLETIHAYALTSKTIDTSAWHKRLGYINEEYMKKDSTQETMSCH